MLTCYFEPLLIEFSPVDAVQTESNTSGEYLFVCRTGLAALFFSSIVSLSNLTSNVINQT